jgi:methionyl-tRNA formyltransferase
MKISILVDKDSWMVSYARSLMSILKGKKNTVKLYWNHEKIPRGECLVILSYEKVIPKNILSKNKRNLVVHESALPKGKGWSPLTWQILEGKNNIPITLFEATEMVDSGDIYFQDLMKFEGYELIDELRGKQGKKTIELVVKFFDEYPNIRAKKQEGEGSFYPRRKSEDSKLDINKSLKELFGKLRVVDNERYPAFFKYMGHRYIIKIYKDRKEN